MSPACLPSRAHRPVARGEDRPTSSMRCAFEDASHIRSVRYHRAPPSGLSKDPPLHRHHHRCPLPGPCELPRLAPSAGRSQRPTRSALVVSHHLDGFLHRRLVGLLHPTADPGVHRVSTVCRTCKARFSPASPPTPYPPEPSPPAQPYPHLCWPLPSCRFGLRSWCYQVPSTSRPCSARASVVANHRCRPSTPVALLGFPVSEASHPSFLLTHGHRSSRPLGPVTPLGGRPGFEGQRTANVRHPKATREVDSDQTPRRGGTSCLRRHTEVRPAAGPRSGRSPVIADPRTLTPDVAPTPVVGDEDHRALLVRRPWQATVCVKRRQV